MKIQITFNEPQIEGYVWASPLNKEMGENFYKCWEYCMDAQCSDFYGPSILNLFTTDEIEKIVPLWAKLIAPNGKILLGGVDLYILSRKAIKRSSDLGTINNILFNKNYTLKSLTSIESTKKFLENLNFNINNINIDENEFNYTVEGIKNG